MSMSTLLNCYRCTVESISAQINTVIYKLLMHLNELVLLRSPNANEVTDCKGIPDDREIPNGRGTLDSSQRIPVQ